MTRQRRKVFLIISMVFIAGVSGIVVKRLSHSRPSCKLSSTRLDLGEINSNAQPVEVPVTFENVGYGDLIVTVAGSSCGCVKTRVEGSPTRSGKQGQLVLQLDPVKSAPGPQEQEVLLATNDSSQPYIGLTVRYSIVDQNNLRWSPEQFNEVIPFGRKQQAQKLVVVVLGQSGDELVVDNVTVSPRLRNPSSATVAYGCRDDTCGKQRRAIRIEAETAPNLDPGVHLEYIAIKTSHVEHPIITVPVRLLVEGAISVCPPIHLVNRNENLERRQVCVRSVDGSPLPLLKTMWPAYPFVRGEIERKSDSEAIIHLDIQSEAWNCDETISLPLFEEDNGKCVTLKRIAM